MSVYRELRKLARPLRKVFPSKPNLYNDAAFLSYVRKKRDGLLLRADEIQTIALRGSTADYSFIPGSTTSSYNLGLTSSDFFIAYHQYIYSTKHLNKLRNIILFASVFSPGFNLSRTIERYRSVSYGYFFDIPMNKDNSIAESISRKVIKSCKNTDMVQIPLNYYGYDIKTYYGVDISADDRAKTHMRENVREPDQMIWVQMLIDEARAFGHRVYIIIPPFRSDYKKSIERRTDTKSIFKKYYNLTLGDSIIFNYYSSPEFGDDDMGDTDHLNEAGAGRLTEDIMRRIAADQR